MPRMCAKTCAPKTSLRKGAGGGLKIKKQLVTVASVALPGCTPLAIVSIPHSYTNAQYSTISSTPKKKKKQTLNGAGPANQLELQDRKCVPFCKSPYNCWSLPGTKTPPYPRSQVAVLIRSQDKLSDVVSLLSRLPAPPPPPPPTSPLLAFPKFPGFLHPMLPGQEWSPE